MALDSWDDLRILLAVARAGTLTGGAKALCVDQTTVSRRLRAFEGRTEQRLFERMRGGVVLTAAGELYVQAAIDLEDRLLALDRETVGESGLSGPLRLTMPDLLARSWMPALMAFAGAHPALRFEVITGHQIFDLGRREADVAVRYVEQPPEHLFGRKVGQLSTAVYAHRDFDEVPVQAMPWVGWDPVQHPMDSSLRARDALGAQGPVRLYVSDYLNLIEALRLGAGAALLPCLTGDRLPELSRRTEPKIGARKLWVLTHEDLRKSAKVRVLMTELIRLAEQERASLLGER